MRSTWTIARKDLRLLTRDPVALFLMLGLPVLYGAFFGIIFDGIGRALLDIRLEVALIDEDRTEASADFVAALLAASELRIERLDRPAAEAALRRGDVSAFVQIPRGFATAAANPLAAGPVRLEVGTSPRRHAEAGLLRALLMQVLLERGLQRLPGMLRALGGPADGGGLPIEIAVTQVHGRRPRPRNAFEVSFPQGLIWGVLACAAGFGTVLAREREQGTLLRLQLAPVTRMSVLAGKALACCATITVVSAGMLVLGVFGFGMHVDNPVLLAVAVPVVAIAFTGIMMLLATLGRSSQAASGIAWSVLTVLGMVGGALVPTFLMPAWLEQVSRASPVNWALAAITGPLWRGYTPGDMLLPAAGLVVLGSACFACGWIVLARRTT